MAPETKSEMQEPVFTQYNSSCKHVTVNRSQLVFIFMHAHPPHKHLCISNCVSNFLTLNNRCVFCKYFMVG